jgi:cation transport ATPase
VSRTLFADPGHAFCRRFVARLFAVREVESLVIHAAGVEIRYAPERTALPRLVRRIAAALARGGGRALDAAPLYLSPLAGIPLRVRRYGDVLSTWEVCHALPGRFRVRHPCLRRRSGVADALLEELAGVPGVLECRVGLHTGSLLVRHDPRRLGRDALLLRCESALHKAEHHGTDAPSVARFGVGSALLGLAVAGHFAYPPLLAVCATLLVAANVDTFRRAWKALRSGSLDVDVLYGTLLTLTVLSGDFLSIAFMAWSVAAWPLLLDRRLAATRHALTGERRRLASLVRVRRAGLELRTPAASLRAGDVTVVEAGATLPADGVVIEGTAAVDERRITGEPGVADKEPGQPVYAGARVVSGRLVIEVVRAERDAVATEIRRRLMESARVEPVSAPGAALARRAAPPALALSAVGAMTGGLGTAIAVLAPNYSAAPGLATPLDRSATLLACADAGFLVRDEAALLRLAQVSAVVIDAGATEPEAAALVSGLRARGIEPILLTSPADAPEAAGLPRFGEPAGSARLLRRLRRQRVKVAFIGRGEDQAAAREADVAIALGGVRLPAVDLADVVLVTPRLGRTLDLIDVARLHARETRLSRHLGLWPNVLAVGGAFVVGFASLHCVLLSNLGALAVYWRGSGRLSDAEAVWRAHRP